MIVYELKVQCITISEIGIYYVLKRANKNHRLDSLFDSQEHLDNPIIERYHREIGKKKEIHIKLMALVTNSARIPSILATSRDWYKSINRPERMYVAASVFPRSINDKKSNSTIEFFQAKVIPIYKLFSIPLNHILIDMAKSIPPTGRIGKIAMVSVITRLDPELLKENGIAERFNRALLDKFCWITMMKKVYASLSQLQHDLDKFVIYYNFKRTNQGDRLKKVKLLIRNLLVASVN